MPSFSILVGLFEALDSTFRVVVPRLSSSPDSEFDLTIEGDDAQGVKRKKLIKENGNLLDIRSIF